MSSKKWKAFYESNRKYNESWEKKFVWLKKVSDGSENAYCKLCRCNILPKLSNLSHHKSSDKHKKNTPANTQKTISVVKTSTSNRKVDEAVKIAQLKIAVSSTCHSAIRTIDHLGEIIVQHGIGSPLGELKLHRTKCISLIKNVISPALKSDLIKDLQEKKYALIIDESINISVQKYLCILVRFWSDRRKEISTQLLGLIPVQEATGENIFNVINEEIKSCGQTLENCIGFASDGAANMVRCNNSVWSKLKTVSPYCVQLRCICHSLALCIQHAVSKLPSNIGFLLVEIPSWFSHSSIRREAYKDLFQVMNTTSDSQETVQAPLPFKKLSPTRWLVRGKVMLNILMNWEELKVYFISAEEAETKFDTKYKLRMIREMLVDHRNQLYFHFATPLVQEFERLNSLFQKNKADPQELNDELFLHYRSLRSRIYNVNNHRKDINNVDFGAKFITECNSVLQQHHNQPEYKLEIFAVKERCLAVLDEALMQVEKRLLSARTLFKDLSKLSPSVVLNQVTRATFSELPFQHLTGEKLSVIEDQYRKLPFVDWREEVFNKELPLDSEQFWQGVLQHPHFKELSHFALNCLITPISNATVERVFSLLTCVKTKARNRMKLSLLEAIIRIRTEFLLSNKCCKDFLPSDAMIKNFRSDALYATNPSTSSTSEEENLSDDELVAILLPSNDYCEPLETFSDISSGDLEQEDSVDNKEAAFENQFDLPRLVIVEAESTTNSACEASLSGADTACEKSLSVTHSNAPRQEIIEIASDILKNKLSEINSDGVRELTFNVSEKRLLESNSDVVSEKISKLTFDTPKEILITENSDAIITENSDAKQKITEVASNIANDINKPSADLVSKVLQNYEIKKSTLNVCDKSPSTEEKFQSFYLPLPEVESGSSKHDTIGFECPASTMISRSSSSKMESDASNTFSRSSSSLEMDFDSMAYDDNQTDSDYSVTNDMISSPEKSNVLKHDYKQVRSYASEISDKSLLEENLNITNYDSVIVKPCYVKVQDIFKSLSNTKVHRIKKAFISPENVETFSSPESDKSFADNSVGKIPVIQIIEKLEVVDECENTPVVQKIEKLDVVDKCEKTPVVQKIEKLNVVDKCGKTPVVQKIQKLDVVDKCEKTPVIQKIEKPSIIHTNKDTPIYNTRRKKCIPKKYLQ
ncbi:Zinc finger protein 862 like protein [Argiope bruennichi]|uniref:Zinc finger protein 862 like protein n=1 Tax=Argiope bruennichi TaxID=94029 RepID=A0A8T0EQY2_ARGBR|nr:Zinc finger protein 862 like protein [Argiope bruennichi]